MKYAPFVFLTIMFLGCESKSIMPLKTGNYWHYHWAHFNQFGDTLLRQKNSVSIIKDTTFINEHWYAVRESYGDTITKDLLAINRPDGLYKFYGLSEVPRFEIPYPAKVGATVVHRDTLVEGYPAPTIFVDSLYLQSMNASVTVPAGTFNCYLYIRTDIMARTMNSYEYSDTSKNEEYYTPGLGLVRGLYYGSTKFPGKPNEEVLMDYKVN
jgi:hypothetical protein